MGTTEAPALLQAGTSTARRFSRARSYASQCLAGEIGADAIKDGGTILPRNAVTGEPRSERAAQIVGEGGSARQFLRAVSDGDAPLQVIWKARPGLLNS
jgi:hypothetical protein